MHVWHIGAEASQASIGGVNFVAWTLASRQAAQGAEVTMVVTDEPDASTLQAATDQQIRIIRVPQRGVFFDHRAFSRAVELHRPTVAVLHSVFLPRLIGASIRLRRAGVPQLFMAHGALAEKAMRRSALRKRLFVSLFERPRLRRSDGVILCTPSEAGDITRVAPGYDRAMYTLYNPIELDKFSGLSWAPPPGRPTALFIGRLDIEHKGVDRLFAIARLMPDVDFAVYGNEDPRYGRQMAALMADAPANLSLRPPVFGDKKARAYAEASILVQPSRWEGFPIITSEAMAVGLPAAISSDVPLSADLAAIDCGLVLPTEPAAAAHALRGALADKARLSRISANAKRFAQANFDPDRQAAAHLEAYDDAVSSRQEGSGPLPEPQSPPKPPPGVRTAHPGGQ